jgi:hypothetical protein
MEVPVIKFMVEAFLSLNEQLKAQAVQLNEQKKLLDDLAAKLQNYQQKENVITV